MMVKQSKRPLHNHMTALINPPKISQMILPKRLVTQPPENLELACFSQSRMQARHGRCIGNVFT
jgi:hypothetical protein